eukprot:c13565_g1_i1.p1 GENE.c13565_g1_i1~~c13565_g1_i1.p1  ORF type:complete len:300 (+),score=69.35 c13565_g1_i1:170-1069(+)
MVLSGDYQLAKDTADFIKTRVQTQPKVAIICGSGLGVLADEVDKEHILKYEEIPNFPHASVLGHVGQLVFGKLAGMPVVLMQGRFHRYEGYTAEEVTRIVRVFYMLGAETLVVTNAAGALNQTYKTGDIMLIKDHIGLANLAGNSALVGPNDDRLGTRFPDMSNAYSARLRMLARTCANQLSIPIQEGVFALSGGPSYETPAEVRTLALLGGDSVAMSTVPEVTVARHIGLRVVGFSMISNVCKHFVPEDDMITEEVDLHKEVLETVQTKSIPNMRKLLRAMMEEMVQNEKRWKKEGAM